MNLKNLPLHFFLALLLCLMAKKGVSQSSDINYEVYYYEVPFGSPYLSIEEVPDLHFKKAEKSALIFGPTKSVYWAKIVIKDSLTNPFTVNVECPLFDSLQYSYLKKDSSFHTFHFGFKVEDLDDHTTPTAIIDPKDMANNIVYIRGKTTYSFVMPIHIRSVPKYYSDQRIVDLFAILLLGGLFVMMLYNFILYTSLKEVVYLIYSLDIFVQIFLEMSMQGYSYQIIPQNHPAAYYFVTIGIGLNVSTAGIFGLKFFGEENMPKWIKNLLWGLFACGLVTIASALLGLPYISIRMVMLGTMGGSILLMIVGSVLWYRGLAIAKYFQIAWSIYLIGIIIYGLRTLDIVEHNYFTYHAAYFGKIVEVCLMSFALGYKFNTVRKENMQLQYQLNKELEILVEQRTKDLNQSIQEKEVLLKEIHHRVKNNLQVISSLLNIQARSTQSIEAREVMKGGQSRIKSMALIHQKLYSSDNLTRIDMDDYTLQLTDQLQRTFKSRVPVDSHVNMNGLSLDLETAIPVGLILTELVMNAYKYAFQNRESGNIYINLIKDSPSSHCLTIKDDGIGMPPMDLEKVESLGLSLVDTLSKQINGVVAMANGQGTSFTITFNDL